MVAPSFQTYKIFSKEPFLKNGKLYVTIEHPRTHNLRDVRWYTEAEYEKAYGKTSSSKQKEREVYLPGAVQYFSTEKTNTQTILRGRISQKRRTSAKVLLWEEYYHRLKETG